MAEADDKGQAAEEFSRVLEIELAAKRAAWQREREKHRVVRVLSFSFLSVVIIGALIAFLFIFSRMNEAHEQRSQPAAASTSP